MCRVSIRQIDYRIIIRAIACNSNVIKKIHAASDQSSSTLKFD